MKETRAIFANFFRDYWSSEEQNEKIHKKQDRDRKQKRVELLQSILEYADNNSQFSPKIFLESKQKSGIYNEIDWILMHIPRCISKSIPVAILSSIVCKKISVYNNDLDSESEISFNEETISIVKYLLDKYVSWDLIETVILDVPEDFDLSSIFD